MEGQRSQLLDKDLRKSLLLNNEVVNKEDK